MAVVGFSSHAHSVGVLAEDTFSHLTQRLGPTKEVIAQRARQSDIIRYFTRSGVGL